MSKLFSKRKRRVFSHEKIKQKKNNEIFCYDPVLTFNEKIEIINEELIENGF